MSSKLAIDIEELEKEYGGGWFRRNRVHALKGVTLQVPRGEIFGLLGPNGAGKTTLIKVLLGIVRKTAGKAEMLDHSVGHRESRRRVGYLPEHHRFPRHHTGYSALEFYGSLSGLTGSQIRERRAGLLKKVGLEGWEKTPIRKYSKGMQQRLGLAQALLHDPDLIILDEPTDGVDPEGRKEIRILLQDLKNEGRTVFINSHLLQEVELVCDRVAILDKGNLRRVGSVEELTQESQSEVHFKLSGADAVIKEVLGSKLLNWNARNEQGVEVSVAMKDQAELDDCIDQLRAKHISLLGVKWRRDSLEDAFLNTLKQGRETI